MIISQPSFVSALILERGLIDQPSQEEPIREMSLAKYKTTASSVPSWMVAIKAVS